MIDRVKREFPMHPQTHERHQYAVGDHVVYEGKSYRFPGVVTMRDDTGVVVKAFGDSEGNYTGMKHIYADHVLKPYTFAVNETGIPPLILFADENPFPKMRAWAKRHNFKPFLTLFASLDKGELASE